ncbi:DOPA-like domain-containing protein [Mycena vitilis]|nr:DOPA-like domain-containing protein [Mycena vitilis]
MPMFEVNVFTPHQTGALFSWLAVNRGPCSVLIHPNTDDELADHTTLATWMGTPLPLKTDIFQHTLE